MARTLDEWREYLTRDITNMCARPSMWGTDVEGLVVTQVFTWYFAQGLDPHEHKVMDRWRRHVAGIRKVGPLRLVDALVNPYWYNLNRKDNFYEIEHIVGCALASWARSEGLDVPDPIRRPEDRESAPEASATSEVST